MSNLTIFTNVAGFSVSNHVNASNQIDYIIDFESGDLEDDKTIALFQYLVDTGLAWSMQGSYGRTARSLIEAGLVYRANDLNRPGVIEVNVIDIKALSSGE